MLLLKATALRPRLAASLLSDLLSRKTSCGSGALPRTDLLSRLDRCSLVSPLWYSLPTKSRSLTFPCQIRALSLARHSLRSMECGSFFSFACLPYVCARFQRPRIVCDRMDSIVSRAPSSSSIDIIRGRSAFRARNKTRHVMVSPEVTSHFHLSSA